MTIEFVTGDLFEQDVMAIGHGVNCKGVMGGGIAVLFKRRWPDMYEEYKALCYAGSLTPGLVHPFKVDELDGFTWVYNIASQFNPGPDAKHSWLRRGLRATRLQAETSGVYSVAFPRIASDIGGLNWTDVAVDMEAILDPSPVQFKIVSLPGAEH